MSYFIFELNRSPYLGTQIQEGVWGYSSVSFIVIDYDCLCSLRTLLCYWLDIVLLTTHRYIQCGAGASGLNGALNKPGRISVCTCTCD